MKIRQRFAAALAAIFILSGSFPVFAAQPDKIAKTAQATPETAEIQSEGNTEAEISGISDEGSSETEISTPYDEEIEETELSGAGGEGIREPEVSGPGEEIVESEPSETTNEKGTDDLSSPEITDLPDGETSPATEDDILNIPQPEAPGACGEEPDQIPLTEPVSDITESAPLEASVKEAADEQGDETDFPIPEKAPPFHAHIEYWMNYTVVGTFTDFTPDVTMVRTMASPDGENWLTVMGEWNLFNLNSQDENKLNTLQNQPCLFSSCEPLKSFIEGKIDRFYVKLRITRKSGLSYDTQVAVIERGGVQPVPEGTESMAIFSSSIAAFEADPDIPNRYRRYGRYQFTIPENATEEDISALLPDTLPVEVHFYGESNYVAIGVIDCPVTWKPLSLPRLCAGESITIKDAAEEILVPADTLVSTPLGTFRLEEPLDLNTAPSTDEVRLILNVRSQSENPSGVLEVGREGLEVAFYHKPTGATSIQAYVLSEGETKWTALPDPSLSGIFSNPTTENSGYILVLPNDQEPYRSYLAFTGPDEAFPPFYIGLKINGGIYDGKQLILAWPDNYKHLPTLPQLGGAGGNEVNAGSGNKDDSTESGQRPNLPHIPGDSTDSAPLPEPSQVPNDSLENEGHSQTPDDSSEQLQPPKAPKPDDSSQSLHNSPAPTPGAASAPLESQSASSPGKPVPVHQPELLEDQSLSGQRPNLPQPAQDAADTPAAAKTLPPLASQFLDQEDILRADISAGQEAADKEEEKMVDGKTADGHTSGKGRRIPLLPLTAAVATGGCIGVGAVVSKATGYRLIRRIADVIRNVLYK